MPIPTPKASCSPGGILVGMLLPASSRTCFFSLEAPEWIMSERSIFLIVPSEFLHMCEAISWCMRPTLECSHPSTPSQNNIQCSKPCILRCATASTRFLSFPSTRPLPAIEIVELPENAGSLCAQEAVRPALHLHVCPRLPSCIHKDLISGPHVLRKFPQAVRPSARLRSPVRSRPLHLHAGLLPCAGESCAYARESIAGCTIDASAGGSRVSLGIVDPVRHSVGRPALLLLALKLLYPIDGHDRKLHITHLCTVNWSMAFWVFTVSFATPVDLWYTPFGANWVCSIVTRASGTHGVLDEVADERVGLKTGEMGDGGVVENANGATVRTDVPRRCSPQDDPDLFVQRLGSKRMVHVFDEIPNPLGTLQQRLCPLDGSGCPGRAALQKLLELRLNEGARLGISEATCVSVQCRNHLRAAALI